MMQIMFSEIDHAANNIRLAEPVKFNSTGFISNIRSSQIFAAIELASVNGDTIRVHSIPWFL